MPRPRHRSGSHLWRMARRAIRNHNCPMNGAAYIPNSSPAVPSVVTGSASPGDARNGRADATATVAGWSATGVGLAAFVATGHLLPAALAAMAAGTLAGTAYEMGRRALASLVIGARRALGQRSMRCLSGWSDRASRPLRPSPPASPPAVS